MVIDPTNYKIAVELAEAAVQQAQANAQNAEAQIAVQQAQINASQAQVEQAKASLVFAQQQAARYGELAEKGYGPVQSAQQFSARAARETGGGRERRGKPEARATADRHAECAARQRQANLAQANAQRDQAKVNLDRTQIRSPVNGWVTNLLAQLGDYANVGQNKMSLVDANSFWVDAYFDETALGADPRGRSGQLKLMGYSQIVRGHVDSIARGINVPNAQPEPARARHRQPDLHLGAPGAAHPGAHPYRSACPRTSFSPPARPPPWKSSIARAAAATRLRRRVRVGSMDPATSALLTDLYQLNMMQAYLDHGETKTAVFEFFVRKLPARRGFLMAAGLEQALEFLEKLRFSPSESGLAGARAAGSARSCSTISPTLRFTGDVHAMPEGTVFFADEPILRVTAPLPQAQLVETRLINILHFQIADRRQGGAHGARRAGQSCWSTSACAARTAPRPD